MRSFVPLSLAVIVLLPGPAAPAEKERHPAGVMGAAGAAWLERQDREEEQRPAEVIRTMGLRDGDVVADLGAGTGYFTRPMAKAVAPLGALGSITWVRRPEPPRASSPFVDAGADAPS